MCLDTVATGAKAKKIEAKFEHGPHGTLIGYQMIDQLSPGVFRGVFFEHPETKVNAWCHAESNIVCDKPHNPFRYMSGFHVCHDSRIPEQLLGEFTGCCIAKVKVKGPFTFGRQDRQPIAVAAERRIVKILKRYPKEKES